VDPFALTLVLVAAIFHAAWNRLLHETRDRVATMAVAGLIGGALLLPAAVFAPPSRVLPLIVLSALAEAAYALCLSAAYRRGALSLAYPIGWGVAPLLVTLGGWLVLAQEPMPVAVAAAGMLVAGLVLVATARRHATNSAAAIGFATLTGVTIATYSLIDARAVHQVSPASYLGVVLVLESLLLVLWMRGSWSRLRRAAGPGIGVAVGTVAAYLLVLLAFQRTGTGRVATLREISVLVGLLLAREQVGWRVWIGAALVVSGAVAAVL